MILSEGIEELRFDTASKVMKAMAEVAADPKADMDHRLKAAKIVDGMSDSIIHALLIGQAVDTDSDTKKKMLRTLDNLNDKEK